MKRCLWILNICGALALVLSVGGCGSSGSENVRQQGSNSSESGAPLNFKVSITFPLDGSLTGGKEASFRVKGTVRNNAGESVSLNTGDLQVNGVLADIKNDALGEWFADVPLSFGENVITATYAAAGNESSASITLDNGLIRSYMSERRFNGGIYGVSSESLQLYTLEDGMPSIEALPEALKNFLKSCDGTNGFEPVTASQALFTCNKNEGGDGVNYTSHLFNTMTATVARTTVDFAEFRAGTALFADDDVVAYADNKDQLSLMRLSTGESITLPVNQLIDSNLVVGSFELNEWGAVADNKLHLATSTGSLISLELETLFTLLDQGFVGDYVSYDEMGGFTKRYSSVVVGNWACSIEVYQVANGVSPLTCFHLLSGQERIIASESVGAGPIWQVGIGFTSGNNFYTSAPISQLDDETIRVAGPSGDGVFEVNINTLIRDELAPARAAIGVLHSTDTPSHYLSYNTNRGIATLVDVDRFSVQRIAAPKGRFDVDSHGLPFTRATLSISGDSILHLNNHNFTGSSEQGYPLITQLELNSGNVSTVLAVEDIASMLGHDLGAYRYRIVEARKHPETGYIIALGAVPEGDSVTPFEGLFHLSTSFDELTAISVIDSYEDGARPEAQPLSNIDPESGSFVVVSFNDGSVSLLSKPYNERRQLLAPGEPFRFVTYPFVDWERGRLLATGFPLQEGDDIPDFSQPTSFALDIESGELIEFGGRGITWNWAEFSFVPELDLYHSLGSPYELGPSLVLIDPDSGDSVIKPLKLQ